MPDLNSLRGKEYIMAVKRRLGHDGKWAEVTTPDLVEHTRWALKRLMLTIAHQKEDAAEGRFDPPDGWFARVNKLQKLAQRRYEELPEIEVMKP